MKKKQKPQGELGNRSELTREARTILEDQVLPNARRQLETPALRRSAEQTLRFWGEEIPEERS